MIEYRQGNLLEADAEALVNTVNCVGVMGKGIALQFKHAFPDNYDRYRRACEAGEVQPGRMFIVETGRVLPPRYVINFPTKRHWKGKSRLEDVRAGLDALVADVRRLGIGSLAVPPLGCGHGGLAWDRVRPLIESAFTALPEVRVQLFAPADTGAGRLTPARAALLSLMSRYAALDYPLTAQVGQHLAYMLQTSGEPLRLRFARGKYGPHAARLAGVLRQLDGTYLETSRQPGHKATAVVRPGAADAAAAALAGAPETQNRILRVERLIEGFETPFGLELLASVHWVTKDQLWADPSTALDRIHGWSVRHRRLFEPHHVQAAWDRLRQASWLAVAQSA
jgi:O-acetyl-ADP-ribose deacetylase (regulator of RNase III)